MVARPIIPAAMAPVVKPRTAPKTPYPSRTSPGPTAVLTMAWQMSVKLLSSILS